MDSLFSKCVVIEEIIYIESVQNGQVKASEKGLTFEECLDATWLSASARTTHDLCISREVGNAVVASSHVVGRPQMVLRILLFAVRCSQVSGGPGQYR